jgi:hypothetical protein
MAPPDYCQLLQVTPDPEALSVFTQETGEDRWAYFEYTIGPSGRVQELRERFASVPGMGQALLDQGKRGRSSVDFGPGRYEVFQFERPEGAGPVRGRRLSLRNQGVLASPGARSQSGEIAARLETNGAGALQVRDVLFASSPSLQRLLPELVGLLEVKSSGTATESVLDVAFFKIEGGQVDTLTVSSYIPAQ